MPEYRVIVIETTSIQRVRTFHAATEEDARSMAEAEDWREWPEDRSAAESHIESVSAQEGESNYANPTPRI